MASVPATKILPPKWLVARHFWPRREETPYEAQLRIALQNLRPPPQ